MTPGFPLPLTPRKQMLWFAVWLVFLAYPVSDIVAHHHSALWVTSAWLALAVFVALYLTVTWRAVTGGLRPDRQSTTGWLAALVVFTLAATAAFGGQWGGMIIYLGVATGVTMAARPAIAVLAAVAAAAVLEGLVNHVGVGNVAFVSFLTTALGVTMLGGRRVLELILELRQARDAVARLTVAEQRQRFSRDLHDVLGHSLSAIALNSQVARRTMASDPGAAVSALANVEAVAHQSLRDMRELVSGYRERSLEEELAAGRELLTAAGIRVEVDQPDTLPDGPLNRLLGWAVREGVTNVVRHSRASRCAITVTTTADMFGVEVDDDGRGPQPDSADGSGLRGLQERAAEAGGRLEAGGAATSGYRLAVSLPLVR